MPPAQKSFGYVTPIGRVRYDDDVFKPPPDETPRDAAIERIPTDFVARFHAIVEEMTDELMATGDFDRATCRVDALALLTEASERLLESPDVESPLRYLLMEERQKAAAALGLTGLRTTNYTKA